jgi:mRNA interferase MazF
MKSFIVASDAISAWDVIVVPFPYSERLAEKRRPALVISNDTLHRDGYLWIAMITGSSKERRAGDLVIRDLGSASLPGASMVRVSKIATIEPERILRRIGTLAKRERAAVRKAVIGFLGE